MSGGMDRSDAVVARPERCGDPVALVFDEGLKVNAHPVAGETRLAKNDFDRGGERTIQSAVQLSQAT